MNCEVLTVLLVYLAGVNILGFSLMGIDKWKARKRAWRIPEATLFFTAVIGGSVGSIIGMQFFRHKTKHWMFVIGMPAILIIQMILFFVFWKGPVTILTM